MPATPSSQRANALLKSPCKDTALRALRGFSPIHPEDEISGRIGHKTSGRLGAQASVRISKKDQGRSILRIRRGVSLAPDPRQRAIVKLHYHAHSGDGGGKLLAHGRYLERDGAGQGGEAGRFYDRETDADDAPSRLSGWEKTDRRHIRIILAPESGGRFSDLKDLTRAVMARVERDLGVPLEWVAVDHHNTDNPHSHIILRGRRSDGPDLIIPRNYAISGLRYTAQEVATEILGERGREDERLALAREVEARSFNRLDVILEKRCDLKYPVHLNSLGRNLDPQLAGALKGRLRSLERMGLATELSRDAIQVSVDWKERLRRAEAQVDIKRILNRPLAPHLPKTRVYSPTVGSIAGEVMLWGERGDDGTRAFVVLQPESGAPILVNTSAKTIRNIEAGDIAIVQPRVSQSRRASLSLLKPQSLTQQTHELAFNALDQELQRRGAGLPPALPPLQPVNAALQARADWLLNKGLATHNAHGILLLSDNVAARLKKLELRHWGNALSRETGKPLVSLNDAFEREWRVRSIGVMKQGRYAALERTDGVAIMRISSSSNLKVGKDYAIKITSKGFKITPSLGLER